MIDWRRVANAFKLQAGVGIQKPVEPDYGGAQFATEFGGPAPMRVGRLYNGHLRTDHGIKQWGGSDAATDLYLPRIARLVQRRTGANGQGLRGDSTMRATQGTIDIRSNRAAQDGIS